MKQMDFSLSYFYFNPYPFFFICSGKKERKSDAMRDLIVNINLLMDSCQAVILSS